MKLLFLLEAISFRHLLLVCLFSPIFLPAGDTKIEKYGGFSVSLGERGIKGVLGWLHPLVEISVGRSSPSWIGKWVASQILFRMISGPGSIRGQVGGDARLMVSACLEMCLYFLGYQCVLLSDYCSCWWSLLLHLLICFHIVVFGGEWGLKSDFTPSLPS